MRLASYDCRISIIGPEEGALNSIPNIVKCFRFPLTYPARALRQAIQASRAEYLVPTDDLSVWLLHEVAESTPALRPLIEKSIGSSRFFPKLRSRFELLSLAHGLGIAVPKTELIESPRDLERWCTPEGRPFVLKKDGTWGGEGVQIVHNLPEAHRALEQLKNGTSFTARAAHWMRNGDTAAFVRVRCMSRPEITAQTMVEGVPANSMYACHRGRILGEVQARVVASKGHTGPSLVVQLINDPRITRAGGLLAEALQLSGFFGLDFMLDSRTGEPFLIELNPRSTKLGHLSVANQPDLAGMLWAQWSGQPAPAPGDPNLASAVCFYPEGDQWTRKTSSLPGCRSDTLPAEAEVLARLSEGTAARSARLRQRIWNTFQRLKGSLQDEPMPHAFYFQDLSEREELEGLAQVRPGGQRSQPAEPSAAPAQAIIA